MKTYRTISEALADPTSSIAQNRLKARAAMEKNRADVETLMARGPYPRSGMESPADKGFGMNTSDTGRLAPIIPDADVPAVAAYAREWVADCEWSEDDVSETLTEMSDAEIIRSAAHHYDGGIRQLYRDAMRDVTCGACGNRWDGRPVPAMLLEPPAAGEEHEAMQNAVRALDDPYGAAAIREETAALERTGERLAALERMREMHTAAVTAADDAADLVPTVDVYRPRGRGKRHMAFYSVGSGTYECAILAPDVTTAVEIAQSTAATAPDGAILIAVYACGDGYQALKRYLRDDG